MLPTGALLTQFHTPNLGPFVKNFNLIYLDIALTREQNLDLYGPQLIRGISRVSQSGLKGFFPIMMKTLARWEFDYESPVLQPKLELEEADVKALAGLFQSLMLFDGTLTATPSPPAYISRDAFPNLHVLNAAKLAAVKLCRGALERQGHTSLFIGARDGNSQVADFCADAIKRDGLDFEDESFIRGLYSLYFQEPRLNIRIGIVEAFGRSVVAANLMPDMPKLLEKGFQGNYV
jgi:Proteasome stabiliser